MHIYIYIYIYIYIFVFATELLRASECSYDGLIICTGTHHQAPKGDSRELGCLPGVTLVGRQGVPLLFHPARARFVRGLLDTNKAMLFKQACRVFLQMSKVQRCLSTNRAPTNRDKCVHVVRRPISRLYDNM